MSYCQIIKLSFQASFNFTLVSQEKYHKQRKYVFMFSSMNPHNSFWKGSNPYDQFILLFESNSADRQNHYLFFFQRNFCATLASHLAVLQKMCQDYDLIKYLS